MSATTYLETLERLLANPPVPNVTTISPHFEHKVLSAAEKQELIEAHRESCKTWNAAKPMKNRVQRDSKGATVERFGLHIDPSKSLYEPPDVVCTGQVKNIVQVYPVKNGPERGHWAAENVCNNCGRKYPLQFTTCRRCKCRLSQRPVYRNGRRLWIEGQHNHNRQRNPRNPDEPILGTKLMNQNFELEKCLDETTKQPITDIDDSARIVTLGLQRRVYDRATQTAIIDDATKQAAEVIRKKFHTNAGNVVSSATYQTGAKGGENPESHK